MIYETQVTGCIELIWAVILQAARDAIEDPPTHPAVNWRDKFTARQIEFNKKDSLEWINSKDGENKEGSLQWYCHLIGMDGVPRIIKRFIKDYHPQQIPIESFKIGEIKRGREIGKTDGHLFIWARCEICEQPRWVIYKVKENRPLQKICQTCSGRINNLKNQK